MLFVPIFLDVKYIHVQQSPALPYLPTPILFPGNVSSLSLISAEVSKFSYISLYVPYALDTSPRHIVASHSEIYMAIFRNRPHF